MSRKAKNTNTLYFKDGSLITFIMLPEGYFYKGKYYTIAGCYKALQKDGEVEKTNDKTDGSEPTDEAQQVQTTETAGNGVRVEDLVTKEELSERLSSLEAKFDAVLKENVDLKDKLSAMEEKYENKDFGNFQRQGVMEKNKEANNSFDEYSKQFM